MARAYVLERAKPGYEREVYNSLVRRGKFAELHPVTDEYSLVATVISDDFERIGYIVLDEMSNTENVDTYETLMSTDGQES